VTVRQATLLATANALITLALIAAHAAWFAPAWSSAFAVLDVGELYRLKEAQVATVLVKRETTEEDRTAALRRAAAFGLEVNALIQSLHGECACLILARGAVVGPATQLPDLTPEVRRRLGL
jgi:hypothetical protein